MILLAYSGVIQTLHRGQQLTLVCEEIAIWSDVGLQLSISTFFRFQLNPELVMNFHQPETMCGESSDAHKSAGQPAKLATI